MFLTVGVPFLLTLARPGWWGGGGAGGGKPFSFSWHLGFAHQWIFRRKFPLSGDIVGLNPTVHQAQAGLFSPINVRSALKMINYLFFTFSLLRLIWETSTRRGLHIYIPIDTCNPIINLLCDIYCDIV